MKRAIRPALWGVFFVLALSFGAISPSRPVPASTKSLLTLPADVTGYGLLRVALAHAGATICRRLSGWLVGARIIPGGSWRLEAPLPRL